jgi:hypothetical protein
MNETRERERICRDVKENEREKRERYTESKSTVSQSHDQEICDTMRSLVRFEKLKNIFFHFGKTLLPTATTVLYVVVCKLVVVGLTPCPRSEPVQFLDKICFTLPTQTEVGIGMIWNKQSVFFGLDCALLYLVVLYYIGL